MPPKIRFELKFTNPNSQTCRTCGGLKLKEDTIEIFGEDGRRRELASKIKCTAAVEVSESDIFPKSICYRCLCIVENFYNFRTNCLRADHVFNLCKHLDQKYVTLDMDLIAEFRQISAVQCQNADDGERQIPILYVEPQVYDAVNPLGDEDENEVEPSGIDGYVPRNELGEQETPYPSDHCSTSFSSKDDLAHHSKMHEKENLSSGNTSDLSPTDAKGPLDKNSDSNCERGYYCPYPCKLCPLSYSSPINHWGHVSVFHRGEESVRCLACTKFFFSHNLAEQIDAGHMTIEDQNQLNETATTGINLDSSPNNTESNNEVTVKSGPQKQDDIVLHSCSKFDRSFKTPELLANHYAGHTRRASTETSGSTRNTATKSVSFKKFVTVRTFHENCSKLSVHSNKVPCLLKRTLLKNHELAELRSWKQSPSKLSDEVKLKKRPASSIETASNSGSRHKNSKLCKIQSSGDKDDEEGGGGEGSEELDEAFLYVCEVCCQVFDAMNKLTGHRIRQAPEETDDEATNDDTLFACTICEKSFSLRIALMRHFKVNHVIDPSEIRNRARTLFPILKKQKNNASTIENGPALAESQSDSQSNFICEVCYKEFGDRGRLWLHLLESHKQNAAYACGICLKLCVDNSSLSEHWKTAHPPDSIPDQHQYLCQICGHQYDSKKKLLFHFNNVHYLDNGARGKCDPPETVIAVNTSFYKLDGQDPNSISTEKNPSLDVELPSEFGVDSIDNLVKHKKSAHKLDSVPNFGASSSSKGLYEPYFICELCGSSHTTKTERWRHVFKAHNGHSALTCELPDCRKVFPTPSLKQEHSANHHRLQGVTPNVCEICGKLWGGRAEFWKHLMSVHQDCVPFTCGVCLKVFCEVSDLRNHVQMNHLPLIGDFCCDICGHPCSNSSKLSRHHRIHLLVDCNNDDALNQSQTSSANFTHGFPYGETSRKSTKPKTVYKAKAKLAHTVKLGISKTNRSTPTRPCGYSLRPAEPKSFELSKHKCEICSKEFSIRSRLKDHQKMSHVPQYCELCSGISFTSKVDLLNHIKETHSGHPNFTCPEVSCSRTMRSKSDCEKHQTQHNSTSYPPTCYLCGEVNVSKERLWSHLNSIGHRDAIPFTCGVCFKHLPSTDELLQHVKKVHPEALTAPDTCRLCAKSYSSICKVLDHFSRFHPDYYACKECLEAFHNRSELQAHSEKRQCKEIIKTWAPVKEINMENISDITEVGYIKSKTQIDLNESQLPCEFCNESFPTAAELMKHSKSEHRNDVLYLKSSKMTSYEKRKRGRNNENDNSRVLKRQRTYECEICFLSLCSTSDLADHKKRMHTSPSPEIKPFHCDSCDKNFVCKSSYMKHMNSTHLTKQVQLQRSTLSQSNGHSSSLGISENQVNNNSPECNSCKLCGKNCLARKHMWQHLIQDHRQEAAVTCGICLEICKDYHKLASHLRSKHFKTFDSERTFTCRICGRCCGTRSRFSQHKAVHIVLGPEPEHQPRSLSLRRLQKKRKSKMVLKSKVQVEKKEYKCDLCSKICGNVGALVNHRKAHQISDRFEELIYSCDICTKVLKNEDQYFEHKKSHDASRGKNLPLTCDMKLSVSKIEKGNFFVCDVCESIFLTEESLAAHTETH